MNVNEYGVTLQFCVSFNMANQTSLSFTFTKPDGTTLTVVGTLGVVQVSTPLGIFAADTYATYTFTSGQVTESGTWKVRLTYTDASPAQLISNVGTFVVGS
jgi:hypothetical protein